MHRIGIAGTRFQDTAGRHVILRGVNFGGDCKVPALPDGRTHLPTDFSDHRTVSFVGRPAPLDEVDAHLRRLAHWGFNCLRLLTTWEAVEHAGPGMHDKAYLDYFTELCRRAGQHGFYAFIDFHQDAWARMSGGDGAPGWTFEAAGLDFTRFDAADAAHVMQHRYDRALGGRQPGYPVMSWGANYRMPANCIMWTLFFAGQDFAPSAMIEGQHVQDYLQSHYLGAMRAVAERVAGFDHVVGFDTLNEPGTGYIGKPLNQPMTRYRGHAWSPLDGLAVASGVPRAVAELKLGGHETGELRVMNPDGVPIWLPGREDPFRAAGAWDIGPDGAPFARKPDFFMHFNAREVEIERDYMLPFFHQVAETVRSVRDDWLIFAEVDPFSAIAGAGFPDGMPDRTVNASHWYDLGTLVTKRFEIGRVPNLLTGEVHEGTEAIEDAYAASIGRLKAVGDRLKGGAPTLLGECGIPFDMNEAEAYRRWAAGERDAGIWQAQTTALDHLYNVLDRLLLSSTQWNYSASNRNDPAIGDGWNQEDLSIWSLDQVDSDHPDAGARALQGFCRPWVRATDGILRSMRYDRASGRFEALIDAAPDGGEAEIYLPWDEVDGSGAPIGRMRRIRLDRERQTRITFQRPGQQAKGSPG